MTRICSLFPVERIANLKGREYFACTAIVVIRLRHGFWERQMKVQVISTSLIALFLVSTARADLIEVDVVARFSEDDIAWLSQNGVNEFDADDLIVVTFTALYDDVDVDNRETHGVYLNAIQEMHLEVGDVRASASSGETFVWNGIDVYPSPTPSDAFGAFSSYPDSVTGLSPGVRLDQFGAYLTDGTSTVFDNDSLSGAWDTLLTTSEPFTAINISVGAPLSIGTAVTPEIFYQSIVRVTPEPSSGFLVATLFLMTARRSRQ